jgi:hypothetical protein
VGFFAIDVGQESGAILVATHAVDVGELELDTTPGFDEPLELSLPVTLWPKRRMRRRDFCTD